MTDFCRPSRGRVAGPVLSNWGTCDTKIIRQGKLDKTIRGDLKDVQIVQFIYMLMSGMVEEMEIRKSELERIRLNKKTIISNMLALIAFFLKKDMN